MVEVTSIQGDTIDRIVYRHYGTNSMLEAVINANPDLTIHPVVLPAGTIVKLPAIHQKSAKTRLW